MRRYARDSFDTSHVEQAGLPSDTLAVWFRLGGAERHVVADSVPLGAVAGVTRHLTSHASTPLADALGVVKCVVSECNVARSWLTPAVCTRSAV